MAQGLRSFWTDQSGAAMIEYPLILALVSVVMIGSLVQISGSLDQIFVRIATELSAAVASPAPPPPPEEDDDD